jgi:hypothetical protein
VTKLNVPMRLMSSNSECCLCNRLDALCKLRKSSIAPDARDTVIQFDNLVNDQRAVYASVTSIFKSCVADRGSKRWWEHFPLKRILNETNLCDWANFEHQKKNWFCYSSADSDSSRDRLRRLEAVAAVFAQSGNVLPQHFENVSRGLDFVEAFKNNNPITVAQAMELKKKPSNISLVNATGNAASGSSGGSGDMNP